MIDFDTSRLSNAGKEAARAHKNLRRASEKLMTVVNEAIAAGLTAGEVEYFMLKFCSTREEISDAVSLFEAACRVTGEEE